ncbi:MAG: F0F1 ATP synthase subunit delta, partial [Armatimonadetes bacterium CG_4_9_14_3_um_filter_58_7]
MAQVVAETPDFMNVMRQPRLPAQQKKGILLSVFGGSASTLVLDFLCLLIDK